MKILTLGFSILMTTVAFAASPRLDNTQLFVKMKAGKTLSKSALINEVKPLFSDLYLVKTSDASKLAKLLKNNASVKYTEGDSFSGSADMPEIQKVSNPKGLSEITEFNDPKISQLWGFDSAANAGMSVHAAYAKLSTVLTPEEVIVAVVDTGVEYTHEDLKDVMWVNAGEIPGDRIDNDKNGYIDDVHGINTLVRDAQGRALTDPKASHWHGTHVSGTIAATQNNGVGIAGVSGNTKIMAIRTVPDDADEKDSDIVEAFLYAAKNGAKIISCSFGKALNEDGMVVKETIDHIGKKYGVLVIAAAGNSTQDIDKILTYPASFDTDYLLVVAATQKVSFAGTRQMSSFSNYGAKSVDLAAPGSNIYSTMTKNKYGMASGTSMATPNTSGVAATVLGYNPNLSPLELKKVLMDSVTKVDEFKGKMVSSGRVDLLNALKLTKTIE